MKLYAVIQKNTLRAQDFTPRILGITKYPNDAKAYAAEQNDFEREKYGKTGIYTTLDGYELCEVEEFDSEALNTKIGKAPSIWYRFIFSVSGELKDIWNDGYTFKECFEIKYDTMNGNKDIIYVQMTMESAIPESAVIKIANEKVGKFIQENPR